MGDLPPELLGRIFHLSVSPSFISTFSERSALLRSCALVCRSWRGPAQRLLFQSPVVVHARDFQIKSDVQVRQLRFGIESGGWEVQDLSVHSTPFLGWSNDVAAKPPFLRHEALAGLRFLSLTAVELDTELLLALKHLKSLTLSGVTIIGSDSDTSLPQIEHLSLINCQQITHCLLLPQLPSLTCVAYAQSRPYVQKALEDIFNSTQGRLQLLSLGPWDFVRYVPSEDPTVISEFTEFILFDLSYWAYDFRRLPDPVKASIRHIRFTPGGLHSHLHIEPSGIAWERFLGGELHEELPGLQTVVLPWALCEELVWPATQFAERHNIKILIEDDWESLNEEERSLSGAFMRYRKIV